MNALAEYMAQRALVGGVQATAHDRLCFRVLVQLLADAQAMGDTWVFFDNQANHLKESLQRLAGDFDTQELFVAVLAGDDVRTLVPQFLQEFCDKALAQGLVNEQVQNQADRLRDLLRFVYWYGQNDPQGVHQALRDNPFVVLQDDNDPKPLVLSVQTQQGFGVWLHRLFTAEKSIVHSLSSLKGRLDFAIPTLEDGQLNDGQRQAVMGALQQRFCVITGGPGTGKTFCVAKIVQAFLSPNFRLALTAPTGKAALRMQESLKAALGDVPLPEAMTLHRLLGMGRVPLYDQDNPLPYDMIVVDEASMLGAELAAMLCRAVDKNTRLVWLGDSHQLSAVEAGAVLFEVCRHPNFSDCHYRLHVSRRFDADSAIGKLANLVNQGANSQEILAVIASNPDHLVLQDTQDFERLFEGFAPFFEYCQSIKGQAVSGALLEQLFGVLKRFRVLTDTHEGRAGDVAINAWLSKRYCKHYKEAMGEWFFGRVVMMSENRYDLGLYNGDIGVCLLHEGRQVVYFEDKTTPVMPATLPKTCITSAYAMTVHKSQGSEFDQVAIFMNKMSSRELLYTAITRAKHKLCFFVNPELLAKAAQEPTKRNSGIGFI